MDYVVAFVHFIQHILNVNIDCANNKIISFFTTFSSLMGTTDDDIDKFVTTVHGVKSGRDIPHRIFIPVDVIMHLKNLHSELDDRNK